MFKNFLGNFKKLSTSNKSMIYLMWIQWVWNIVSVIFINIYVFNIQKEIIDVIIYNSIFFTSIFIWFFWIGILMSIFSKNIKYMYYYAYILFILAFILLLILWNHIWIYLFAFVYGIWVWSFRCAVHTQELINIKDEVRDIYSSIISSWENIIKIIVPLLIALLFFIVWKYTFLNAYSILFLILPIVYLISFLFIHNIWNYIPTKVKKRDLKHFFNIKKHLFALLYFIFTWLFNFSFWIFLPIIAILLLKSEINIWIFEWLFALISTILIIFISNKRKNSNRVKIMWILSMLIFINIIIFTLNFNVIGYTIYALVTLMLYPIFRVSEHVFDLRLMDTIKLEWSDFYPAMMFRNLTLWIWRIVATIFFIFLSISWLELEIILRIGIFFIWVTIILAWISIYFHIRLENK